MNQQRKTPIRTCISCRETSAKKELMRIVRTADGDIRFDPTGKASGRGAYLCGKKECFLSAVKKNKLARALRCEIPERVIAEIQQLMVEDNAEE